MADVPWTGRLLPPAPISDEHDLSQFDSGVATINAFLTSNALLNHRERYSLLRAKIVPIWSNAQAEFR